MIYNDKNFAFINTQFTNLRKLHGLSIDELADLSGIKKEILIQIEAGKDFPAECRKILADIYGISIQSLLCPDRQPPA